MSRRALPISFSLKLGLADVFLRLVFALQDDTAVLKAFGKCCRHAGVCRPVWARHLGCAPQGIEMAGLRDVFLAFKTAVVSSVLLGGVLFGGCSSDEEQARELMRQRQAGRQGRGVSGGQESDIDSWR